MEGYKDLIEAAKDRTGLSDFGDDAYREGLEILVNALNAEAKLNAAGDHALRDRILMHLSQRLQIEDWYRRHPEIDDEVITAPLFGVSLPRTGSSALSFLLSCDPNIRYLRVWESSQPCPPPSTVSGPDPRRGSAASVADGMMKRGSHTPTGIDGAMECQDLMALTFGSQTFQAFAQIPSFSEWLIDADLTATYLYEKRALKLLQWGEKPRPWRLKAPTHMLYMDALNTAFPDARFVMTHRDPTDVMLSVAQRAYLDRGDGPADRVSRKGQRSPLLRHPLQGDAQGPGGRGARVVPVAGRAGDACVRGQHEELVGRERRARARRKARPGTVRAGHGRGARAFWRLSRPHGGVDRTGDGSVSARIILSVMGSDRPGLTRALAEAVHDAGGNWLESRLSRLGGKYVGSVLVELDEGALAPLEAAIRAVDASGLRVGIVPAETDAPAPADSMQFELVGQDRPGIVREVTAVLARLGVNIEEFETGTEPEAWSGGLLFRARARLTLPADVTCEAVQTELEAISGEIMVDFTIACAA